MADDAPASRKPKSSDFYQQKLRAWQPILTPNNVIITFLVVGVIFTPVGFVLKAASDSVVEFKFQYDGDGADGSNCLLAGENYYLPNSATNSCQVILQVTEDMEPPVYMYYELNNFYQNHRRYVKSRDDAQLKGELKSSADLDDCNPLKKRDGKLLHPCGLIAQSFFNDTFDLQTSGFTVDSTDISWKSDRDTKFKAVPLSEKQSPAVDSQYTFLHEVYPQIDEAKGVEDEHFIVWMRTAALPNFRKLYGKIDTKIPAGTSLNFTVVPSFNVARFNGKKTLVLSTVSWLGGKNSFLGIAYIVVGFVCIGLAAMFVIKQHLLGGRDLGDPKYLVWQGSRSR